jgi:hypothetical protein
VLHGSFLGDTRNCRLLQVQDFDLYVGSMDAAVDWLQQWGNTITFGCEIPFPTPLQCDSVFRGVRLAFISTAGGQISTLGELYLEVDAARTAQDNTARVCVTRVARTPERALPGEKSILRALRNALRCATCSWWLQGLSERGGGLL